MVDDELGLAAVRHRVLHRHDRGAALGEFHRQAAGVRPEIQHPHAGHVMREMRREQIERQGLVAVARREDSAAHVDAVIPFSE